MEKVFVDKDIHVYTGKEAEALLEQKNDVQFFEESIGVRKVSKQRWEEAQYFERKTWIELCNNMSSDRNEDHQKHFDNYKSLNDLLPENISIIELGAGPFTNTRLVLPYIKKNITSIDLLDPLIVDYTLGMLKCPYKNGMLNFHKVNIIPSPIETYLTDKKYDLIIMINVLEHCYDVDVIWNKILSMLNPNGIFIFADKFLSVQNIEEFVSSMRDSGHPLRITDDYINKKISSTFNTVFYSTFIEDDLINEYFILKKK